MFQKGSRKQEDSMTQGEIFPKSNCTVNLHLKPSMKYTFGRKNVFHNINM